MKTQHTPAWTYELDSMMPRGINYIVYQTSDNLRSVVAKVQGECIANEHGNPETIASLIAAAPDLLTALEAMVGDGKHSERESLKMAVAAIAKAKSS